MPELRSHRAVVITDSPPAVRAGVEILRAGGNAIDAAVSAAMVHCVLNPSAVGFGGYGGSLVVWVASERRAYAVDFDARAPLAFSAAAYLDPKVAQRGYLSLGVPGVVAGFDLALRRFGKRSFKDAASAAHHLAADGTVTTPDQAKALKNLAGSSDADTREAMFQGADPPKAGERWVQADLAKLIEQISADPRSFYEGEIARRIVAQVAAHGGQLSVADFARYQAQVVDPIHVTYRGLDVYTPPPPSGGITSLSILKTLEQFPLEQFPASEYKPWGGAYYDLFLNAAKLCWQDRLKWLGDPEFVKVPIDHLLSQEAAAERAAEIRRPTTRPASRPTLPSGEHTVNVIAVDAEGNCASLTVTHGDGFGSHVAIKGLGLVLGHGMSRFNFAGGPDAPQPGKRMQHNMSPTLAVQGGKPRFVVGIPGGTRIVTVTAQLLASLIDFGATAEAAVQAPRVHVEADEPCLLATAVPAEVAAFLEKKGHQIKRTATIGGAAGAAILSPDGTVAGASSFGGDGVAGI